MLFVPVVDANQIPLMPTTPARARRWMESGKATGFFKKGIFCVRLNHKPSARETQPIAIGIDPGSKKEGLTIKSEAHTYLNIQADAVTHVKEAMADRREARRSRRQRKTPYRQPRQNRAKGGIPPSTKARWQWKLRLVNWLCRLFPVSCVVVEDIKANTKGKRRWDILFSPLEIGKNWFYDEARKATKLTTFDGWETKQMRDDLGLKKTKKKMAEVFEAHCVDSWVLANAIVGGHVTPDNTSIIAVTPLILHRRELHRRQPCSGGIRPPYGGTRSLGFKRGSIIKHPKYGVTYVGGTSDGRLSLHSLDTGKRLCHHAKPGDVKFLAYATWRTRTVPTLVR
jgi:hypothetical protein